MTCGTPASTEPMAATCRSSATRPAFRWRSLTSSPARPTTSPPPASPASSARCTPRPPCWGCPARPPAPPLLGRPSRADRGYAGAGAGIHTPAKGGGLHPDTAARNELIGCLRAEGERGIALLKTRWKALRRIRLCPQRIGAVIAAALVLTTLERPIR